MKIVYVWILVVVVSYVSCCDDEGNQRCSPSIRVMVDTLKISIGEKHYVAFFISPTDYAFEYDVSSSGCAITLEKDNGTKNSKHCKLEKVERLRGSNGNYNGHYRAFVKDLCESVDYEESFHLVISGLGGVKLHRTILW